MATTTPYKSLTIISGSLLDGAIWLNSNFTSIADSIDTLNTNLGERIVAENLSLSISGSFNTGLISGAIMTIPAGVFSVGIIYELKMYFSRIGQPVNIHPKQDSWNTGLTLGSLTHNDGQAVPYTIMIRWSSSSTFRMNSKSAWNNTNRPEFTGATIGNETTFEVHSAGNAATVDFWGWQLLRKQ